MATLHSARLRKCGPVLLPSRVPSPDAALCAARRLSMRDRAIFVLMDAAATAGVAEAVQPTGGAPDPHAFSTRASAAFCLISSARAARLRAALARFLPRKPRQRRCHKRVAMSRRMRSCCTQTRVCAPRASFWIRGSNCSCRLRRRTAAATHKHFSL